MMLASRVELQCENLVSLQDYQNIATSEGPAWKTAHAKNHDHFTAWKTTLAKIRDRLTSA
jgi:hypothetical protein